MPQLADPSDIRSRPDSVALGELAIFSVQWAVSASRSPSAVGDRNPPVSLQEDWSHGLSNTSARTLNAFNDAELSSVGRDHESH